MIGPLTGDEGLALQDYARRHPEIAFVNGSSSAQQLDPAPNFFSFWYDGAQWMAGVGAYAYHTLGWRTAVTVANSDAFDWAQAAGFDAEFCSLGGRIVKRIWISPGTQDFSGLLAQVPHSGFDGILVEAEGRGALQALATDYAGLPGNISRKVVDRDDRGHPAEARRSRARGCLGRTPPTVSRTYLASLRTAFPEIRKDVVGSAFDHSYYDAMSATLQALDRVHGDLSGGERAFMTALGKVVLNAPNGRTALGARPSGNRPEHTDASRRPASGQSRDRHHPAGRSHVRRLLHAEGRTPEQDHAGVQAWQPAALDTLSG